MTEALESTPLPPLRIGVMIDSYEQPAWVVKSLEQIIGDDRYQLVAVVMNKTTAAPGEAVHGSRIARLWRNRSALPYALYSRVDRKRYAQKNDPENMMDAEPLLRGCELLEVQPRMTKHCDYFEDADVEVLAGMQLDVVLRLGFRILKGRVLSTARFGIWSYHHADNLVNRGGPPGFWEVMQGDEVTGATLQILTEQLDAGTVLCRSYSRTDPSSVTANKHNYYWQARVLLHAKLAQLFAARESFLECACERPGWSAYSKRLYTAPGAMEMLTAFARVASRLVRRKLRALFQFEQWFIAWKVGQPEGASVPDGSMYRFREMVPPKDRFWADPMIVEDNGNYWMFFEELLYSSPRGHICVVPFGRKGPSGEPRRVLERPYHLSYPFVFRWNGQWYMLPETGGNRTVELYRATSFPHEWEFDRNLLSGIHAVDATLAEIGGRWWMFAGVVAPGATEATLLNIYHADTPLGPWKEHALNPLKVDVRSARPAGPLFEHEGHWYRPAQSGAPNYGSSIVVNRIVELTEHSFREESSTAILPQWRKGLSGVHTIGAAGGITVIDGRQYVSKYL